jgi:hypothetical protein
MIIITVTIVIIIIITVIIITIMIITIIIVIRDASAKSLKLGNANQVSLKFVSPMRSANRDSMKSALRERSPAGDACQL